MPHSHHYQCKCNYIRAKSKPCYSDEHFCSSIYADVHLKVWQWHTKCWNVSQF